MPTKFSEGQAERVLRTEGSLALKMGAANFSEKLVPLYQFYVA